jgi:transposase
LNFKRAENDGVNYNSASIFTSYADVDQHWVVVFSPQAHARALHSVRKQYEKKSIADQKAFDTLCKQDFACEIDALAAAEKLTKKLKISTLNDLGTEAVPIFSKAGRPAKNSSPDGYKYRISASLSSDYQSFQKRLKRKSCFILATNQTDTTLMSSQQILVDYKNQQKVERGFRFLKDPMFLASSVFLKSPKRIMALTMVMTVCLLVYAALEHRIRKGLIDNDESFPNQTGKMIKNPTLRWVFNYFQNIQVLYISEKKTAVLNLNSEHQKLLRLLGESYAEFYS